MLSGIFVLFAQAQDPITIRVDASQQQGKLAPIWSYFGADEPNYTTAKDGKKLLSELAALSPSPVYVRLHNLLTTGDGQPSFKWGSTNAYTENEKGEPVYSWKILDSIFDGLIRRGMKPIAEIGFMPEAMSVHPEPYKHHWVPGLDYGLIYTGWAYPPGDYQKWGRLIYEWVRHCVQRYGESEVKSWWWEVWNEPNIGYWKGTKEEYFRLYDFAADGLKKACPGARIGGPTTTGPSWDKAAEWLKDFLAHCAGGVNAATGGTGAPLDYISWHAKGSPRVIDGHVRMSMTGELRDVRDGFAIVAASTFKNLPIIIGECDPEGCAACSMATQPQNGYRNGTMYSSYTASTFSRIYDLAERYGVNMVGAVSWSFEFEGQRWFDGFRDLATNGVDKPVLNVFRMWGLMPRDRVVVVNEAMIPLDSLIRRGAHGEKPDIHALAGGDKKGMAVMIWNYHDDDLPAVASEIVLDLKGISAKNIILEHYRIDGEHSNSYEAWKKMGSPQEVSPEQYGELEKAGKLQLLEAPGKMTTKGGALRLHFTLPRQGISLVRLLYQTK